VAKKKGLLSSDRKELLDELGFIWNELDDAWDKAYELLKEYQLENPNQWPVRGTVYRGFKFGGWCNKQRANNAEGLLSSDRKELLDKLGFIWEPYDEAWDKAYGLLKEYQLEKPTPWPIRDTVYQGFKLGVWCDTQRSKNAKGLLSVDRKELLDKLGFIWEPLDEAWDRAYSLLKLFRSENPARWPQQMEKYKGLQLGQWYGTQRGKNAKGQLSAERKRLLDELVIPWKIKREK